MRLYKPADSIIFADIKIEKDFNSLSENGWLKKALRRAIDDFKENAFCGERTRGTVAMINKLTIRIRVDEFYAILDRMAELDLALRVAAACNSSKNGKAWGISSDFQKKINELVGEPPYGDRSA